MIDQLRGGGRDKRRGGEEETEEVMVPLVFVSSIFLSGSLMHTHAQCRRMGRERQWDKMRCRKKAKIT